MEQKLPESISIGGSRLSAKQVVNLAELTQYAIDNKGGVKLATLVDVILETGRCNASDAEILEILCGHIKALQKESRASLDVLLGAQKKKTEKLASTINTVAHSLGVLEKLAPENIEGAAALHALQNFHGNFKHLTKTQIVCLPEFLFQIISACTNNGNGKNPEFENLRKAADSLFPLALDCLKTTDLSAAGSN